MTAGPAGAGAGAGRTIGLVAVTVAGRRAAERLARYLPDARRYDGSVATALPQAFADCDALVCFLAVGATVRLLAPLLTDKRSDPAVVCVDEALRYAVPVVGGHAGGGNDLARAVADLLGAEPVLTTGSDATGCVGLDAFGADLGFTVEPGSDLAAVGAAMLSGERVTLSVQAQWPLPALPPNVVRTPRPEPGVPAIVVSDARRPSVPDAGRWVVYRPPSLVVGVGASRGVAAAEVDALIDAALADADLSARSVAGAATVEAKADEDGLLAAVADRGWRLVLLSPAELSAVAVPHPSAAVCAAVGTPSVAEAAALLAGWAGSTLVVGKRVSEHATVAVARVRPRGRLALVGIGPGARQDMTARAVTELRRAAVVVGLDQYVDQVADLLRPGTRVLTSALGAERERAAAAVAEASAGRAVALVGSGDAGVYAMASPALEMAGDDIDVVGVPGVTAALAAAAVLGAPLGHDHVVISLSDLHTPWPTIERRVEAAADADLVTCFYNPASAHRDWQLRRALAVLARRRPPDTPVAVVRDVSRPRQAVTVTALADVEPARVDMRTLVLVGSSRTRMVAGRMVTPREYRWSERDGRDVHATPVASAAPAGEHTVEGM